MGYDRKAAKRAVNLSLNEDLVRAAKTLTGNLSETVETLLSDFVEAEAARQAERERQIDAYVAWSSGMIEKYGAFGDEFSTL
jgi:antitoxin CcdA